MATMNTTIDQSLVPTRINNDNADYNVTIVCVVLMVLATFVMGLRIYSRVVITQYFGADDWAMIPGLLLTIVHTVLACYANIAGGIGKPLWEVSIGEYEVWFKMIIASGFLYPTMTCTLRVSILLFYRRLIPPTSPLTRRLINVLFVLTAVYLVVYIFLNGFFVCSPLSAAWKPFERNKYCGDVKYYHYTVSLYAISLAFDAVLLVLPLGAIWELQLPRRQKFGVATMLVLGASACIAAAYKLAIFIDEWGRYGAVDPRWLASPMSRVIPPQFDRYGYTFWIPSQVEPIVAIIGCSLPALKPLIIKGIDKTTLFASSRRDGSSGTGTGGKKTDRPLSTGSRTALKERYERVEEEAYPMGAIAR